MVPDNIPVEVVGHRLSEAERACPQCGEMMRKLGTEVRETLKLIPAKAVLHRDVYYTYACEKCQKNDIAAPIMKTSKEPAVILGSFASPEAIAHIMTKKFAMVSSLYRQELEWARQGLKLNRNSRPPQPRKKRPPRKSPRPKGKGRRGKNVRAGGKAQGQAWPQAQGRKSEARRAKRDRAPQGPPTQGWQGGP